MAEITLHPNSVTFPPGTTVKVKEAQVGGVSTGEPPGATLSEPTVAASGLLTVTAVSEGVNYVAWANVGGKDQYLRFELSTQPNPEAGPEGPPGPAGPT